MVRLVVLALVAPMLLLGGCLSGSETHAGIPVAHTGHFTATMTLEAAAPAEAAAVRSGSFFVAWAQGADYPTWEANTSDTSVAIENLSAKLFLRATGAVVETGRFPDVMIYAGTGGSWMGVATAKFASVVLPDETYEVDLDLVAPEGGLIVPAGERLAFKVVPVMHQNDVADIEILVGGETASRAHWTSKPVALPQVAFERGEASGETVGSAYAGDAAPPQTRHRTVVTANGGLGALLVWMNTTDAQGVPDIDLSLLGPDGTEIAFSGTPTPREFLRLAEPNLRGSGDYTIVVTSYGSARATFTLEWLLGTVVSPSP